MIIYIYFTNDECFGKVKLEKFFRKTVLAREGFRMINEMGFTQFVKQRCWKPIIINSNYELIL